MNTPKSFGLPPYVVSVKLIDRSRCIAIELEVHNGIWYTILGRWWHGRLMKFTSRHHHSIFNIQLLRQSIGEAQTKTSPEKFAFSILCSDYPDIDNENSARYRYIAPLWFSTIRTHWRDVPPSLQDNTLLLSVVNMFTPLSLHLLTTIIHCSIRRTRTASRFVRETQACWHRKDKKPYSS